MTDFDPTWSPSGEYVAFVSDRDKNLELYETNDRFLLKRLTNDPGFDAFPAWSPDNQSIAFSTDRGDAGNRDLFYMSAGGNNAGVTELTQAPGWDQAPDWQKKPAAPAVGPPPPGRLGSCRTIAPPAIPSRRSPAPATVGSQEPCEISAPQWPRPISSLIGRQASHGWTRTPAPLVVIR